MRDTNGSRSEHHLLSCVSQMLNKPTSTETTTAGMEKVLHHFRPSLRPSRTSIPVLSSPISITFSLIALPLHPSIPLPLSGEEKQTAVRVRLADEFQMTLKGRGADQLSPEERPVTDMRAACMQTSTQRASNKYGHLVDPHVYTHKRGLQLLFESILHLKSAYCQGEGSVCVDLCIMHVRKRASMCICTSG